ncbi:MAG TPA: LPS assembly protein LptD [Candidatus Binatia bacterium]|nr:LPS assembly protein LptD [Candidatus Binatia bacterium]
MRALRTLLLTVTLALAATWLPTSAEEGGARSPFGDLQVRSATDVTEISLEVPRAIVEEDRTQKRPGLSASGQPARVTQRPERITTPEVAETPEPTPTPSAAATPAEGALRPRGTPRPQVAPGALTVNEIHLFFPGATIPRARMITIDDRIVQEARLFPDEGGVSMTVVARRPIYYVVSRAAGELRIRVEPGTLLVAEPTGPIVERTPAVVARGGERARKAPGARGQPSAPIQGEQLVPRISLPAIRKGEGLTVDAEHLSTDEEKNEIVAQGHVTIARAGSMLTADEVRINRDTQRAQATGNIQFTDPQGTIQASGFAGNLEDETGELTNGTIYLSANHLTISGEKIEKSFGQTYHIENGEFTTCQCGAGAPSWSIAGKSLDVTLDGYGLVDQPRLKVLETPVLWLPYMSFPAKKTRQTGLLSPLYGYSKKRGFTYMQPIYVVLNKSADFTIAPDIATSARVGAIGEVRYAIDERSKGVIDASYFNEFLRNNANEDIVDTSVADPTIPQNRWSVTANMRQDLPFELRGFVDSLAVSDDFFLREIPTVSFDPEYARTLRTSRFDSTRGGVYRYWDRATLITQVQYFQDFIQPQDQTLQRFPQLQFFASDRFLDRHLKLGMSNDFTDFVRKQGFDGPRLDLAPQAEVPFRWKEYLNGSIGIQGRETAYHMSNTDLLLPSPTPSSGGPTPTPTPGQPLAKNPTRELYAATAMLATQLSRVFDIGGEHVKKLKHTLEPEVDYLYIPDVEQDDLPTYDFVDKIDRRNLFTYGFTSRLLAKLDRSPAIDRRRPLSVGDLSSFSGVTPSPFDDENTRGGLAALGNPRLSGPTPSGIGADTDETKPEGDDETPTTENESAEERAARRAEEKSAVSSVVEWARLQIFQSYDIRDSLQSDTGPDKGDHFSDVDIHMRVYPSNSLNLIYNSTVNARESILTSANVGVILRDPRERSAEGFLRAAQRASLGLSYRFISDGVVKEVDGGAVVPLADTLSTFFQTRYDALGGLFLEKTGGFRLTSQCQCWIADLSVSDLINPPETQVRFQVTLIGLGSIGRTR